MVEKQILFLIISTQLVQFAPRRPCNLLGFYGAKKKKKNLALKISPQPKAEEKKALTENVKPTKTPASTEI